MQRYLQRDELCLIQADNTMKNEANHCRNMNMCCAERRLISKLQRDASKHGVRSGSPTSAWIRRKYGSCITVTRVLNNGSFGCSVPCADCRREISQMEMRVCACGPDGLWFISPISDVPPSKLSSLAIQRKRGCSTVGP